MSVTVVGEWRRTGPVERRAVWHLAKGRGDADWQDVWCGGGIVYPAPREKVESVDVCADCKQARRASRHAPCGEAAEPSTTDGE